MMTESVVINPLITKLKSTLKIAVTPRAAQRRYRLTTALRSDIPRATNRWEVWSLPPTATDLPEMTLEAVTSSVSKIGTPKASAGMARMPKRFEACSQDPRIVVQARVNPRKRLPQSPMKIRAGLKLKMRKPRVAPSTDRERMEISGRPWISEKTNVVRAEMAATPAERPSMLSRRLKALVIPTTHKRVRKMFRKGLGMRSNFNPAYRTTQAARISPKNLLEGLI